MKAQYALLLSIVFLAAFAVNAQSLPSFSEPALSPDGKEVAFVSGGDIWTTSVQGGKAQLLIAHESYDSRPLYSPDGKYLAFGSTRTGNGDIYVMNLSDGTIRQLTYDDGADDLSAWSPDGKYLYFSTSSRDLTGMSDVYRVRASGGTPMAVSDEPYTNEFFASPSPDGKGIVLNARGIASRQWWRHGHSHIDESEIWLKPEGKPYEKLTERGAKEIWPMWSADGKTIYYVSDRNGNENLWSKPLQSPAKMLTTFTDGRVLWPSMSYDGKTIVFERDFAIWKYDIATQQTSAIKITKQGYATTPALEHLRLTNQFSEMTLSPDGKKIAFVVHGDVFVGSAKDGGDALRVTTTPEEEFNVSWAPDSKSIVYTSSREENKHIYHYVLAAKTETRLFQAKANDDAPFFSPNGKLIAFVRNAKELRVFDLATKKETSLTRANFGSGPISSQASLTWSPDNQWIAFASHGTKTFRNITVVPAAGGEARVISFIPNTFGSSVNWNPDGKSILFNTQQRTEDGRIARIDLLPRTPLFRESKLDDLFTEPAKASGEVKTSIQFNAIQQRVNFLPLGLSAGEHVISHDGKTLLFVASVANQENIYSYSLDESQREPAVAKQITATSSGKSNIQFSPDDKEVYYLEQGRIQRMTLESKQGKALDLAAELDVDFAKEKMTVFQQAWSIQNESFYDSLFHGVNWQAMRTRFEPYAAGAQTPDELRRIIGLMIGELNASHSGISGPGGGANAVTGRIGIRFDRNEYESSGKLKVASLVTGGAAAVEGSIKPGDILVSVDDVILTPDHNIDQVLMYKVGKRIKLGLSGNRFALIQPVNQATEKRLLYLQWVQQQRDYVYKISNGRLGYAHMIDMSAGSLEKFYLDLDAENHKREGVVIDIRNNNGGFVNAYALDVLTRKPYMTMTVRGLPSAPARTQLGQRSLELPTILVTNQHSLSDAEDFTEGYRTMNLGKVVGEPTSGWIIYTSSARLIDGSNMRLPFIKITDHEGKNMELAPRAVDIPVTRALGESAANKDSQLDTAVAELLKQLKK